MADRYKHIRKALEGLRERCAQEAERITARRRTVAALLNNEAVKPCEVAAAIRKIDVQQYCECAARQVEQLAEALRGWWKAHRPVGWTEDQHRSCPHVNLATDAEKALATALLPLLREQEEGHEQ